MDINQFLLSLLHSLSSLGFVESVDFHTEIFILKGRAKLTENRSLQVYFNEVTGTTAFALIEARKRIWGVDFDKLRGWHLHPLEKPESHYNIDSMGTPEIINALREVWGKLP